MNQEKFLDISWSTILKISLAIVSFYLLYLIRDILIWFILALIISVVFEPAISFFQKLRVPRFLSVIFIYVVVFGLFSLFIYLITPVFVLEIQHFLQFLPQYFEKISPPFKEFGFEILEDFESIISIFNKTLKQIAANIFSILFAIFGGVFTAIFVLTIAIFLSFEEKIIEKSLSLFFSKKYKVYALNLWNRCQKKVTGWFGTRILACLFVGLACYLTFWLFDIKYSFILAFLAGILNFIPYVGPLLMGFLIFIIVVLDSIPRAIFTLIVFLLIQAVENNILTPLLTKKFVGLSPVLTLLALAIGGKLWGLLGAIFIIPLAGILFEFLKELLEKKREEEEVQVIIEQ